MKNKSELDRVEPLTAMHAFSQRDLDAAKAAYMASISQVDAAEAALRNAKIELEYTHINSPITGVIGISKVLVGDYIGKLNTGAPLNTVSSIGTLRVRFSISEDEYLKFAKAKTNADHKIFQNQIPVQLVLSDGSVYPETGTISLSNRQIDPATGSLLIFLNLIIYFVGITNDTTGLELVLKLGKMVWLVNGLVYSSAKKLSPYALM